MATYLENLVSHREAIATELATGAKPNYSVDGQSFTWGELVDRLAKLDGLIQAAQGPVEVASERT